MKRLLLAATCLALGAAGCNDATSGGGTGRTSVYLTDSPFPYGSISQVNVYIARIQASASTDTTGLNPASWVTIATPERTFNLLDFQGGAAALLGEADLPADQYATVRVVINTNRSSIVRNDGSVAPVHWPLTGDLPLYAIVESALTVTNAGAQIVIDFDVGRTFIADGNGGFYLIPWIRAVNEAATGAIKGTVTATSIEGDVTPVANVAVSVFRDGGTGGSVMPYGLGVGSGHTDAQGRYVIGYLPAGTYDVLAEEPAFPRLRASRTGVEVTIGGQAQVDLTLALDTTGTGGGGIDTTGTGVDTTSAPTGPVARVTTSPASQTIAVGDSAGVIAMTWNASNLMLTGRAITWTVSDSTVVRVTPAAYNWILLQGAKSGAAILTATSEGVSGTSTVTVR